MTNRSRLLIYGVLVFLLVFHLGGGWYFSEQLKNDALVPSTSTIDRDITVVEVGNGSVTLESERNNDDLAAPGIIGLDWETGYGQLGEIVGEASARSVSRRMTRIDGVAPEVGASAFLDGYAFPGDPKRALGIGFQDVTYESPLGSMGAWQILAPNDLWVIHVHGLGASKAEALRMVRAVSAAGYPQLVINYRNDEGYPADPSGYYRYGQTEWEDVQTAVDYATNHGAGRVVLVGYSTGASHILSYLYRVIESPVVAAIFDSPNIDLEQAVNLGASQRRLPLIPLPLPPSLVWVSKRISTIRFGLSWGAIDYVAKADELRVPILLFHGGADQTVPLSSSVEFSQLRPDLIRLVVVPDADHVRAWNLGPESYERRVVEFLNEMAG